MFLVLLRFLAIFFGFSMFLKFLKILMVPLNSEVS